MSSDGSENRGKLWGIAAAVGLLAFLVLKFLVSYTFWPALILAILIGILVAILLWIGFYRDADDGEHNLGASKSAPASASTKPAAGSSAKVASQGATGASVSVKKSAAKPAAAKPKPKPKAAKPAAKPKAKAKPRAKPAAKATSTSAATSMMGAAGSAMVSEKKAAQATGTRKPVAKDGKPPLLKKPRATGADDLKLIKGVGPGLEKTLNGLGFYHFDQIAGWRKQEIDWVDERLKFKGRIVRDGWVKQCKTLAKGGAK